MAIHRADAFTGFETPFAVGGHSTCGDVVWDVFRARSHKGYFKYWRTTTVGQQIEGPTFREWHALNAANPNLALPTGSIAYTRSRFYVRCLTRPTTGSLRLIMTTGSGGGGSSWNFGVGITSAGKFQAFGNTFSGSTHEGSVGTAVLALDEWAQIDITVGAYNSGSNLSSSVFVRAVITFADASTETVTHSATGVNFGSVLTDTALIAVRLGPVIAYTGSTYGTPGAYEVDFDDWLVRAASDVTTGSLIGIGAVSPNGVVSGNAGETYIVSTATATEFYTCSGTTSWSLTTSEHFPTQTRVALAMPTGAGALAEWTGAHETAMKNVVTGGLAQTAASAGLQTSFAHESLATIANNASAVGGVHLYAQVTGGGTVADQVFVLANAPVTGLGSNISLSTKTSPLKLTHYCDLTARTVAGFDALEWGLQSMHATDNTLYGVFAEVLHDGDASATFERGSDGFQFQWVTWTGDGADRNTAPSTLAGFYPHFIMVWPLATTHTNAPFVQTIDMPGTLVMGGASEINDVIERRTSTGFIAGKTINVNLVRYVALCVRDDGNAGVGGRVFGSGCVMGARAHTFTFGADFAPAILLAGAWVGGTYFYWKTTDVPGTNSFPNQSISTTGITALAANGFTAGSTLAAATQSPVFWWGFRASADRIAHGAVAGQSADAVVTPGGAPYAVFTRSSNTGGFVPTVVRFDDAAFSGTDCTDWDGGPINVVNALTAIGATTFTIKGDASYLDDAPTPIDAYWFAFIEAATIYPPPVAVNDAYDALFGELLTVSAAAGVLANDNAEGAGTLTATLVADVANGTLALAADGSFTYQPDSNFVGADTFTYKASNSQGAESGTATVTITVAEPIPAIDTEQPQLFARIVIGSTTHMIAETALADASAWHGGFKAPRLLRVSTIRRELARDGYRAQTWTIDSADVDRLFRGLSGTDTIDGSYVALYLVFDPIRRAEGTAHRIAAGYISRHRALGGFRYEFQVEDVLGRRLAEYNAEPQVPPKRLSTAEFPGLDPSKEGTVAPIAYGVLSDEDDIVPQGIVPAIYLGTFNLLDIGGIDRLVDAYILVGHACKTILNLYYNPPAWTQETVVAVGDLVHPSGSNENGYSYQATVAGTTGTSEPTWPIPPSLTVVDGTVTWTQYGDWDGGQRLLVPSDAYGTVLVCPYKPGWTAATNLSVNYIDYNGQRYTPIFIDNAFRLAGAVRDGGIVLTANLQGVETIGDGTGTLITSPEEVLQHLLTNYFDRRECAVQDWLSDPGLDDVAMVDGASVAAAKAIADARGGYSVGFLIGADGTQERLFDLIQRILAGADLEMGANRHGQLMVSREDVAAAATVTFDAHDLVSFETNIDREIRANRVESLYKRRYVSPSGPRSTPAQGEPLPTDPVSPYAAWGSGLQVLEDVGAQVAVGRTIIRTIENYIVRDDATAASVASTTLLRGLGPLTVKDGPRTARMVTNWRGLIQNNTVIVELGTVVDVQHPEGLTALGWTEADPARVRVRTIEMDPQAGTVTLEGRVLEEEVEVDMLSVELGGSKHVALNDPSDGDGSPAFTTQTYEVVDRAPLWTCPALSSVLLATAKIVVDCRTLAAGTTVTPQLRNVTASTNVSPTAQACAATSEDYDGSNQHQEIPVTLVAGQQYILRGVVTLNSGALAETFLQGRLEIGT